MGAGLGLDLDLLLAVLVTVQLEQFLSFYGLPLSLLGFFGDSLGFELVVVSALGLATRDFHFFAGLFGEWAGDGLYLRHFAA